MSDHLNKNETTIRVIEQSEIAPPPSSVPSPTILPLTFFDFIWFYCHPIQPIFFYHFPHPTHHFLQTTLPILKYSLSITLQHFFPFSSNLIVPSNSQNTPYLRYLEGDSISFTVAESSAKFDILISNSQDAQNWHPLIPNIPSPRTEQNGTRVIPLMAVQITILPNSGFSICVSFNHLVGDAKSLHIFMKFWSYISKSNPNHNLSHSLMSLDLPSHDRDRIIDPTGGLKLTYFKEIQNIKSKNIELKGVVRDDYDAKKVVRTTLVLNSEQVQKLKKWINVQHVSTFVVTCSLIWFCMIKSEQSKTEDDSDDLCYFMFPADCRGRPEFFTPKNYFGNCLACYFVEVKKSELVGKNGIVVAANGIESKIKYFKSDAFFGAKTIVSDYMKLLKSGKTPISVAGSHKLPFYETDFGWGKPMKFELGHYDSSTLFSISSCRYDGGGIEVGLALESIRMSNFISIFEEQLHSICSM